MLRRQQNPRRLLSVRHCAVDRPIPTVIATQPRTRSAHESIGTSRSTRRGEPTGPRRRRRQDRSGQRPVPRRRAARGGVAARPWGIGRRRRRHHAAQHRQLRGVVVRGVAIGRGGHADQPVAPPRGGHLPGLRRPRQGADRREDARVRRGRACGRDRPARQRRIRTRRRCASRGRRRAGPADLHQRNDRSAKGRDARSRQPRCDVQRGDRRVQADRCRSQPADTAAVPRQRNRRRNPLTAAGRGQGDRGGPVQAGVVLRPDRAEPPHVLLRSTNHLHDAVRPARQREAGHVVGALRHLRGGAGQRRTAGGVRIPLRHPDHRGVRVVRGILRQHGQSVGRRAQARHGGTTRAGSDDPHRRHGRACGARRRSPARL